MRPIVLAACCLAVAGCVQILGNSDDPYCTAEFRYGIVVEARDAATNAPLTGARGAVREGAYVDSLSGLAQVGVGHAAGERAGVYSVEVERAGFATWRVGDVVVSADRCHVRTVRLVARLQPL